MEVGYADTPGVWPSDQVNGWKRVTQSVHEAGGRILVPMFILTVWQRKSWAKPLWMMIVALQDVKMLNWLYNVATKKNNQPFTQSVIQEIGLGKL